MTLAFIRSAAVVLCCLILPVAAFAQSSPKDSPSKPDYWGAIAFTADGSFATSWKKDSKAEAEADVAVRCAKFGRGGCETGSFSGELCVGLATYIGSHSGRRWKLSFSGGATTSAGGPAESARALQR
jgi:Domain of unknown function (DUF4189)